MKLNINLNVGRIFAVTAVVLLASSWLNPETVSAQDVSPEQMKQITKIKSLVDSGGSHFKASEYQQSAEKIRVAQDQLLALAEEKNTAVLKMLKKDHERIMKAQKLLVARGEEFAAMPSWSEMMSMGQGSDSKGSSTKGSDSKGSSSKDDGGSSSKSEVELVSFTKQVAPIIVQHCGQCHVQQTRGRYSAATYASLKKGTRKGVAVRPRDIEKSRLVNLVANDIMPPQGRPRMTEDQLQLIKDWIEQGAKFDGDNKAKKNNLTTFVSSQDGSGSKAAGSGNKNTPGRSGGIRGLGESGGSNRSSAGSNRR